MLDRRHFLQTAGAAVTLPAVAKGAARQLSVREVLTDPAAPVLGTPEGDVTVVEFFDYQCPYCKADFPMLTDVVARDGNVRLLLRDWPLFGELSLMATRVALGATTFGAYDSVNAALMATDGALTDGLIREAVGDLISVDDALAAYDAEAGKWKRFLERNQTQAAALGFYGTPSYVVGTSFFRGALDRSTLTDAIDAARSG